MIQEASSPDLASPATVLVIGCGDIGRRVAALEQQAGNPVAALARSASSAANLISRNIEVLPGDLDQPASLNARSAAPPDVLYYLAPPPAAGDDDSRLRNWLRSPQPLPRRFVYISTSGVYGDCGGAWINEDWPLNPRSERGKRRLDAENQLRAWSRDHGVELIILRVPGIYGPGRLPVERVRQGVPVLIEADAPWSNRIHADDLADACFAAARRGRSVQAFNISDGHPTTMTDYFWRIADLYGLPRPPAITMEEARRVLSPSMLSFLEESKRLDTRRMREELGVAPRYPDLASGLPSCL